MAKMEVLPHMSQHERADQLPLVSGAATVTDVDAFDHNRVDEVVSAVSRLAREYDVADAVDEDANDADWQRLTDAVPDRHGPLLRRLEGRYERAYPSLVRLRFAPDDPVDFVAGQFVGVEYGGTPRAYSLSSSPNDDELELCVRRVQGGRLSTRLCDEVEPGDELTVRGPAGDFILQKPSPRDMIFLATGTGVAPLRSMIDYTFEEGRDVYDGTERDVWLFLGASWEDDLAYREHFRDLDAQHQNFHFVPTLTREDVLTDWDGETAYVQHTLLRYVDDDAIDVEALEGRFAHHVEADPVTDVAARIDPSRTEVYACGISAMVESLTTTASAVGVPTERIESEGYG